MSVYRVTEVIGTSSTSWEDAAAEAIRAAAGTIRDLRVAEVIKQDIHLEDGGDHLPHEAAALVQIRAVAPARICLPARPDEAGKDLGREDSALFTATVITYRGKPPGTATVSVKRAHESSRHGTNPNGS